MKKQLLLILIYLGAVIAANLIVTHFGTVAVLPVGFSLIGLDITTRDYLHEHWRKRLWFKMMCLIGAGSLLSWLINRNAGPVAVGSFAAFLSAGIVDTLIYHFLIKRGYLLRVFVRKMQVFVQSHVKCLIFLLI